MTESDKATKPEPTTEAEAPDSEAGTEAPHSGRSWTHPAVLVGGALALLLFGAAIGVLLGLPNAAGSKPGPDSVDVGFAQDMTVHHEQAVEMASWERDHTTNPQLRQLAYDIETGQSRQIGHMQGWLGLWGESSLPTRAPMSWMPADHMGGHGHGGSMSGHSRMPGMATDEELRRLRASSGTELDILFLQLMLRHHEGGVGMLDYAAAHAREADVRNLANQMRAAQTSESEYMRRLLAQYGASPLPLR